MGVTIPEWRWVTAFRRQFDQCGVGAATTAVVLSESGSRSVLVDTARLALESLGAVVADIVMATPANPGPVPIRSTGASQAIAGHRAAIAGLAAAEFVADCTVEGLLHSAELGEILRGGARVLMVSNEHPEVFERMGLDPALAPRVRRAVARLEAAHEMRVTSPAGTDLRVDLTGAVRAGSWGWTDQPGTIAHWPGGLVLAFPARNTVNGRLVLAPGDVNLTFKEYVRTPVVLEVKNDYVTIEGDGLDADLLRAYLSAFDADAYAVSHVGWGMNTAARWDALTMYDKADTNGTELRAFAGNFLFSTGANETARRFTRGHFDIPMRGCTVTIDGVAVVVRGALVDM